MPTEKGRECNIFFLLILDVATTLDFKKGCQVIGYVVEHPGLYSLSLSLAIFDFHGIPAEI